MLSLLAEDLRRGELVEKLEALDTEAFAGMLREITAQTRHLLEVVELVQSDAFEGVLAQVVRAFGLKAASLVEAETAALRFADASGDLSALGFPRTRSRGAWIPGARAWSCP